MTVVNYARLETLANFLESDEVVNRKGKFDLRYWMRSTNKDSVGGYEVRALPEYYDKTDAGLMPKHCQTTGCALGWAATIEEFRKAGFTLDSYFPHSGGGKVVPKYRGYKEYEAVALFFGLTESTAAYFFSANHYNGHELDNPKFVAARIREYIKEEKAKYSHAIHKQIVS